MRTSNGGFDDSPRNRPVSTAQRNKDSYYTSLKTEPKIKVKRKENKKRNIKYKNNEQIQNIIKT